MKKKLAAGMLALSLALGSLSGCGTASGAESGSASSASGASAEAETGETLLSSLPAEAEEDPVAYATDGAIHMKDTVMTVNGEEIPAGEYFYWLMYWYSYTQYYYKTQYDINLNAGTVIDQKTGQTVGQVVREQAKDTVTTNNMLALKAGESGIEFPEDRESEVEALKEQYTENSLLMYLTDLECLQASYRKSVLADLMEGKLAEGEQLGEIKEEDLLAFAEENHYDTVRYILLYTQGKSEEDAAKEKERADEIYEELKKLSGDELASRFQELQASDNYDGNTGSFTFGDLDSLVDGFREVVAEMKEGEVAESGRTDYGYFVILKEALDLEVVKTDMIADSYDKQVLAWREEAEVETVDALEKLDLESFYEKVDEIQQVTAARMLEDLQGNMAASESQAE